MEERVLLLFTSLPLSGRRFQYTRTTGMYDPIPNASYSQTSFTQSNLLVDGSLVLIIGKGTIPVTPTVSSLFAFCVPMLSTNILR